ncbi:MAG TPA: TraR/DksA family transcriptional regulator [Nitriliruptorales bacterium]|nr:TraR/DksA family transcriptional regulator [Nitriliruptorales bacterium]
MDQDMLDRLRKELEEDRRQQLEQLEAYGADPYGETVLDLGGGEEGFADSGQVTEQRSEALAQIDQSRHRLQQIGEALTRMDDGVYGVCVDCGNEIDPARLEARPLSIRCVRDAGRG